MPHKLCFGTPHVSMFFKGAPLGSQGNFFQPLIVEIGEIAIQLVNVVEQEYLLVSFEIL